MILVVCVKRCAESLKELLLLFLVVGCQLNPTTQGKVAEDGWMSAAMLNAHHERNRNKLHL